MVERELIVRSKSPLALHADRASTQFTPGLEHIPGATLRGALAAQFLQSADTAGTRFGAWFLDGAVSFPDLLPSTEQAAARLLPLTAMACKRYKTDHPLSLTDALLRLELIEVSRGAVLQREEWKTWEACPDTRCAGGGRRDRLSGYYTSLTPAFRKVAAERRIMAGTSIHRATGTAQQGMLFSHEVVEEDQYFRGIVRCRDEATADALEAWLPAEARLRVGYGRSRGLGLIEVVGWAEPAGIEPLEARWTQFNRAVKALWGAMGGKHEGEFFSLTLESHLILRDECLQPITTFVGRQDNPLGLPGSRVRRYVIAPATVQGWNAAQGLPKPDAPAIGRGSVLLFCVTATDQQAREQLVDRLGGIEAEGLGDRRGEGFGRVRVCDPFHSLFTLNEVGEELP